MRTPQPPYFFDGHQGEEPPKKPTPFDLLTKLIIPGLALAAVIVAQLQQQQRMVWALVAVFFASLAFYLYSPVRDVVTRGVNRVRDDRATTRALPEFRRFVRTFGEFVDLPTHRIDTLDALVFSELCQNNSGNLEKLRLAPSSPFSKWCHYLKARVEQEKGDFSTFRDTMSEFNYLVSLYAQHCVMPIFERFPQELRHLLTARAKSSLESFRERFVRFLDNYEDFRKNFFESLSTHELPVSTHELPGCWFPRPKPL